MTTVKTAAGTMKTGTVKWFQDSKGYGFIVPDDGKPGDKDIFVHQKNIVMNGYRTLAEGQKVEFEMSVGPDGRPQAVNVKPKL